MSFTLDDFKAALAARLIAPIRGVDVTEYANRVDVLALTMIGEGRGLSLDGRVAIGMSAFNRSVQKPLSIVDICLAKLQYSCWWAAGGVANNEWLLNLAERVVGAGASLERTQQQWVTENRYLAGGVLTGAFQDRTRTSTHYMTAQLYYGHSCPKWATGKLPVINIDGHVFFNDIPW